MALKALWLIKLYGLIESTMALSLQVVKKREVFRSSMTSLRQLESTMALSLQVVKKREAFRSSMTLLRQLESTMALSFEKRNDFLETKTSFETNVKE